MYTSNRSIITKVVYNVLVVSLAIGLGNSFQTRQVERPIPITLPAQGLVVFAASVTPQANPLPTIAPPRYAGYQWAGYYRVSPLEPR
jgi:hypothetical protein